MVSSGTSGTNPSPPHVHFRISSLFIRPCVCVQVTRLCHTLYSSVRVFVYRFPNSLMSGEHKRVGSERPPTDGSPSGAARLAPPLCSRARFHRVGTVWIRCSTHSPGSSSCDFIVGTFGTAASLPTDAPWTPVVKGLQDQIGAVRADVQEQIGAVRADVQEVLRALRSQGTVTTPGPSDRVADDSAPAGTSRPGVSRAGGVNVVDSAARSARIPGTGYGGVPAPSDDSGTDESVPADQRSRVARAGGLLAALSRAVGFTPQGVSGPSAPPRAATERKGRLSAAAPPAPAAPPAAHSRLAPLSPVTMPPSCKWMTTLTRLTSTTVPIVSIVMPSVPQPGHHKMFSMLHSLHGCWRSSMNTTAVHSSNGPFVSTGSRNRLSTKSTHSCMQWT